MNSSIPGDRHNYDQDNTKERRKKLSKNLRKKNKRCTEHHLWNKTSYKSAPTHHRNVMMGHSTFYVRRKKKKHGSWANLKGGGQLATKTGNGEQMCGMVTGLGSVSGCPHIPAATSVRCAWTQVHTGVVGIYCDQPVCDRCVVFDFVARWKEGFMSMLNRNFARL